MMFDSNEEAKEMYYKYAGQKGFSVGKDQQDILNKDYGRKHTLAPRKAFLKQSILQYRIF